MKRISISLIIQRHEVDQQQVVSVGQQAGQPRLQRREHASPRLGHYHLGAELVEAPPQRRQLQRGTTSRHRRV